MSAKTVAIPVELTADEAWDFARLLKRAGFPNYHGNAW
jgi:hypothetical protein